MCKNKREQTTETSSQPDRGMATKATKGQYNIAVLYTVSGQTLHCLVPYLQQEGLCLQIHRQEGIVQLL